ncbi:hypothetical protein B9Q04_16545 [Candidatus Marsarchaeota G2 archaeon BE_D]|jgi:ABC-type uncharacterized transport system, permease component|uniref:ABC transporter permease n=1 Tax=Candidatus Marsarchaeota G2 archaeon BE_D TaxID=1978158 RepID=A0A2R6C627_9ARCH|nr:MAG: hypothetical protein B9Q04_16545 [Candidatus Marsarchaeota G2 archaeon BE_D]
MIKKGFDAVISLLIIAISLALGSLLVLLSNHNPLSSFMSMLIYTWGSESRVLNTISASAPLILDSLGLLIAFKSGFWNAGGEGQMLLGGIITVIVATTLPTNNSAILLLAGFASAFLAGGSLAAISGFLKVKFNANEIVTTLLLSEAIAYLVAYLVRVPYKSTSSSYSAVLQSKSIPAAAMFPSIFGLNYSFIVSVVIALLVYVFFKHTKGGFKLQVLGSNVMAAQSYYGKGYCDKLTLIASFISGGLLGAGGMIMVSAFTHVVLAGATGGSYSVGGFTNSYGFVGIAVIYLAQLNSLLVIPASLFFVTLVLGGVGLEILSNIPSSLALTIAGVVILLASARLPLSEKIKRRRKVIV